MSGKRGRPPVGPVLEVRLPEDVRAALAVEAERCGGLALSALARLYIEAGLKGDGYLIDE